MGVYKTGSSNSVEAVHKWCVKKVHCTAYTHMYVLAGKLAGNGSAEKAEGTIDGTIDKGYSSDVLDLDLK